MLLAVAGLDDKEIAAETKKLAEGDFSPFTTAEQTGFAFARKQAQTPWEIAGSDVEALIGHFGFERALDVIWWTCRCHYMTRVADAFQLPLERENVFSDRSKGEMK